MYTTKTNGTQDIRVSYHGGINNCDMQRSFNTGDAMYKKWIADAEFKATDWELKGAHQCRSEKMKNRKQKRESETKRKFKAKATRISEYKTN
jgi:poly(3-hydroxybutyrate) depolymerase